MFEHINSCFPILRAPQTKLLLPLRWQSGTAVVGKQFSMLQYGHIILDYTLPTYWTKKPKHVRNFSKFCSVTNEEIPNCIIYKEKFLGV